MPRRTSALALAPLTMALGLAATAGAGAAPLGAVLGGEGELFHIEQGRYGELMGQPRAPEAEHSVLVLRVQRPDRPDALYPLPATLGSDVESAAALLYEEASATLFVAWETRTNYIHSQIRLAGFSAGAWGEPIDVSDRRFSFKNDPRLAVTRDAFEGRDAEGQPVTVKRTVLHLVWEEDRAEGLAVVYSPVILVDGAFEGPGPGPIFALTDLVTPPAEDLLPVPMADLPLPVTVAAGSDSHSVVVGFVHPASGRLVAVDLSLLSGDISALADDARGHIIALGARYDTGDPGELRALADDARGHIIALGARLDPTVLAFVAAGLHTQILETGADFDLTDASDVESLGDLARGHIIALGARLEGRGLRLRSGQAPQILDFAPAEAGPRHQIDLEVVPSRRLEGLATGAEPVLLLSPTGGDALIAWEEDGQLRYQESRGDGWSETRAIALATIERERALEIVEQRIRNR